MATQQTRGTQGGAVNNRQAQLGNAYQELGRELGTDAVKVVGGYTLGRVIGEGTFGSVHIATHRLTGTRCAIKKIPKSATAHLTRELHHHRRLHHPHIVHLHEIVATETHVWLVSELCSGGELFDYLVERGRLLEGEARRMFGELTVAVGWLHRQGVVHRDLKLENVLLDGEMKIKLGDLGFAREWQKGRLMETFCGTTGYASPEMLACRKYLGLETDIWSLGVILYTLLCGGLPFDDDDERVMKELIFKGEYEEPEWLSEEARSLIRAMLQQDPAQRLSIEGILSHPWFKMTIVDHIGHPEGQSLPTSPNPAASDNDTFTDSFRGDPGPSSARFHPANPSPLTFQQNIFAPDKDSEASETSFDFSEKRVDSGVTTPTTTEEDDDKSIPRVHSGEFSQTERTLELLHPNASQTTIKRGDETPNTNTVKSRVAVKSSLEGQAEEEEDEVGDSFDQSLQLPLALHSRTPSRTKRRSVSSQLSLERRLSHHSMSGQWQSHAPEDYLGKLNEEPAPLFSRPSEKHLLSGLSSLGFDVGQLQHSVNSDACDASAATWWILRQKQAERGETDEAVEAMNASAARRKERAAAYAREERRRAREKEQDKGSQEHSRTASPEARHTEVTFVETPGSLPNVTVTELGPPIPASSLPRRVLSPEPTPLPLPDVARLPPEPKPILTVKNSEADAPQTPPREVRPDMLNSPTDSSPRERERIKARSPSMSMLQRATSVLTGKKIEEKPVVSEEATEGRTSPTKLVKPKPKMTKSESEGNLLTAPWGSPASSITVKSPVATPQHEPSSLSRATSVTINEPARPEIKPKANKRDSLWTAFRHMFVEDRRRRKREGQSPLALVDNQIKIAPAVVLSRGPAARSPHVNRVPQPNGRRSLDVRPQIHSRRSSSVNSRRSSITSAHLPADLHDSLAALGRHTSHRSHGSQTPTSDREHFVDYPSRPGSVSSLHRGGSRRSSHSMNVKSPSIHSESSSRYPPPSPLHKYQRRSVSGFNSTRVQHIRVIPETQILRSSSVASSVRSNASSRRSSIDKGRMDDNTGESDYDTGRDDVSIRSLRRRLEERRGSSLANQIHRTRSPLVHGHHKPPHKPKAPIRDVFQQKDDEWEDEDEVPAFEGGLGQAASSFQSAKGADRAASFPTSTPAGKRRNSGGKDRRAERGDEPPKRGGTEGVVERDRDKERENVSGGGRRGMQSSKPPMVMEEVEEEEEE